MPQITNPETDALHLASIEPLKKGLFGRITLPIVEDGSSMEVFRNNVHLVSLYSNNSGQTGHPDFKLQDNDIVVRVNHAIRPLQWTNTLSTKDHFERNYSIEVFIFVNNAVRFALSYLQSNDPVRLARLAMHGALVNTASLKPHDEIGPTDLHYHVELALSIPKNQVYGLMVEHALAEIAPDPRRAKALELDEQIRQRTAELNATSYLRTTEINTETYLQSLEIKSTHEIKRVESDEKARLQELQDKIAQDEQRRQAAFRYQQEAAERERKRIEESKQNEHQFHEESKQNTHMQEEDAKQQIYELERRRRDLIGEGTLQNIQHELDVKQLQDQDTLGDIQYAIDTKQQQREQLRLEQVQINEIATQKRQLLASGDLDAIRHSQESATREHERLERGKESGFVRIEEAHQHDHEHAEGSKQQTHEFEWKKRDLLGEAVFRDIKDEDEDKRRTRTWSIQEQTQKHEQKQAQQNLLNSGNLDAIRRRQESERSDFARLEERKKTQFTRLEEIEQQKQMIGGGRKKQSYEREQALLNDVTEALRIRIKEDTQQGYTQQEIMAKFPIANELISLIRPSEPDMTTQQMAITEDSSAQLLSSPPQADQPELLQGEVTRTGGVTLPGLTRYSVETFSVPALGVSLLLVELTPEQSAQADLDTTAAWLVWRLLEAGPASRAEILVGDMFIALDGTSLTSLQSFSQAIQQAKNAPTVQATLIRGGKRHLREIPLTL